MRVAVLGGGLQGCCIALLLAERGVKVTLFERHDALLQGAALNNEGRLHLGYVYGSDPTLATARLMIRGALSFAPILDRLLARPAAHKLSRPFHYAVHRDSQRSPDELARYLDAVHDEIEARGRSRDYFGIALHRPQRLGASECEAVFDGATVAAAFRTAEVAVDTGPLCEALRARVAAEPNIALRLAHTVTGVADTDSDRNLGYAVDTVPAATERGETFDQVVNALWDGRLAIDAQCGIRPQRPWLHRLKYGFRFKAPAMTVSSSIVLGPFGDTIAYADGTCYATWYPVCMRASAAGLAPPPVVPLLGQDRAAVWEASLRALRAIVPAMRQVPCDAIERAETRQGIITAPARTDIDDPASELHARHHAGVHSSGGYHSVDPGKFTLAPYFAKVCADRILAGGGRG
jgi:hypothetical protein